MEGSTTMKALEAFKSVPRTQRSQLDYILLDGSSSMQDKWWDSLDAIEAYVQGLKREAVHSHLLLSIADWKPLREAPIGSDWGMTPLYDAINNMGRELRDLDPPRCSIVIVTDGEENGSKYTTLVQAKAILDWCRAKGWQVTFIGADFANARQARLLGAVEGSSIGVAKANLKLATDALAKKRAAYGLHGTDMHYTDGEQQQFGGYLGAPK
jgi:hypothetical protein